MRYVTRPRAEYWDESPTLGTTVTVIEVDKAPVKTGLFNHHGDAIFRQEDAQPIGFDTRVR